jgi:hypothetical protein
VPRRDAELQEEETRRGLKQLIDLLAEAANDRARDPRFTAADHQFFRRQRDILLGSVAELIKILEGRQPTGIREHRPQTLFEALGAACVIAGHTITDEIKNRLTSGPAAAAKKAKTAKRDQIIIEVAKPIWQKRRNRTPWRVAGEMIERLNQRLLESKYDQLRRRAIAENLERLKKQILD